eukprot:m.471390 g.471390  ORF g.471390 m.471390 type:complete len:137 (-) comp21658_c0_seq20:582-992(-)
MCPAPGPCGRPRTSTPHVAASIIPLRVLIDCLWTTTSLVRSTIVRPVCSKATSTSPVHGQQDRCVSVFQSDHQLSWEQWRQLQGGTQDAGSVIGTSHPFANHDWATSFNVTLDPNSEAARIGIANIDVSDVGPRHA